MSDRKKPFGVRFEERMPQQFGLPYVAATQDHGKSLEELRAMSATVPNMGTGTGTPHDRDG